MEIQTVDHEESRGNDNVTVVRITDGTLTELTEMIEKAVKSAQGVNNTGIVRKNTTKPMIKSSKGDKVYIKSLDDGSIRVKYSLASQSVKDEITVLLNKDGAMSSEGSDDEYETEDTGEEGSENRRGGSRDPTRERDPGVDMGRTRKEPPSRRQETEFTPPFTKEEANYYVEGEGPNPQFSCTDCVHYAGSGQCKLVQGGVNPDDYCNDLYADLQINGRIEDGDFDTNLIARGDVFSDRLGSIGVHQIVDNMIETLKRKMP